MTSFISIILTVLGIYLLIGVLFSIAFLWKGVSKVDPAAADSSFFFKVLLFPGMSFLWIFFLPKWLKSNRL